MSRFNQKLKPFMLPRGPLFVLVNMQSCANKTLHNEFGYITGHLLWALMSQKETFCIPEVRLYKYKHSYQYVSIKLCRQPAHAFCSMSRL